MHGFNPAPGFKNLKEQTNPVNLLRTILKKSRIPHALLFTGNQGLGKESAAMTFAMAANCFQRDGSMVSDSQIPASDIPCLICKSCRKILNTSHPDMLDITPQGNVIKISQIRDLLNLLNRKPNEALTRVVLIHDAHKMNVNAANALLKMLEEPPDKTIFILLSVNTGSMLATIRSRCQTIRFNPVHTGRIEEILITEHGFTQDKASLYASLSDGSILNALSMMENEDKDNLIQRRNWLINQTLNLSENSIFNPLAMAERLSSNKELAEEALDMLTTYFRDLIICNYQEDLIINRDLKNNLLENKKRFTVSCLITKIDNINNARIKLASNTGMKLTLEVLFMQLAEV